jgi:FkbM family methyltransferase
LITLLRKGIGRYHRDGLAGVESAVRDRLTLALGLPVRTVADLRNALVAQVLGFPLPRALRSLARRTAALSVVQVGAFVGDTANDPLYGFVRDVCARRPGSVAVLVEPVAEHFARLRDNYADVPNVRLENVAVADAPGVRPFYRLGVDPVAHGFPGYLAQLGSLDEDRMGSKWDRYERRQDHKGFVLAHRVVDLVPCVTLHDLLARHGIADLDLLQVDAEGYDYRILRTVDFARCRPRFVNYERVLLHEDEPACRRMMRAAGYRLVDHGQDTLCIRR